MSEHTPTPWVYSKNKMGQKRIFAPDGREVVRALSLRVEREANAAFVVRACNAHDDMLHALEMVRDANRDDPHIPDVALRCIESAIAKATGAG